MAKEQVARNANVRFIVNNKGKTRVMAFNKGKSGNPKGRPRGAKGKAAELRELLKPKAPDIVKKVVQLALGGDSTALRLCLERIIPPIKSKDEPVNIPNLDGTKPLTEQAQVIITAIGSAEISPSEGSTILSAIASKARVDEIDELAKRIEALEEKAGAN